MMKIMGMKTDLMEDPQEFIETTPDDDHFFFMVQGNTDDMNVVHYRVYMDGDMVFEGGTNLDADGKQNVRFDIPEKFRTPGEYEIAIELFERDDAKPDEDQELIDDAYYTLYIK